MATCEESMQQRNGIRVKRITSHRGTRSSSSSSIQLLNLCNNYRVRFCSPMTLPALTILSAFINSIELRTESTRPNCDDSRVAFLADTDRSNRCQETISFAIRNAGYGFYKFSDSDAWRLRRERRKMGGSLLIANRNIRYEWHFSAFCHRCNEGIVSA